MRKDIFSSITTGNVEEVKCYLDKGGDPNLADEEGFTILMRSVMKGHVDLTKVIVEAGADCNNQNKGGATALLIAARYCGHAFREGKDITDYKEIIHLLLNYGAKINFVDPVFGTVLHELTKAGAIKMLEFVLEKGADPNLTDEGGWTPLHYAVFIGRIKVAQLLLQYGARKNIKTLAGDTPIDIARKLGAKRNDILRLLSSGE
ncbi:ankyrin repeat domain-containing protein [Desmospora profundinema]|uniref:Ankyrin repeat protein n=1 Tax=Desmospora profundinema TaxID=1571184 RepID=A0ABU1IRZ0_9BACL|nr:ankyrin repeat domain-containing protein [Desmospora profundinema]MDR6227193.1 ankyrin repeat protein [Desmospora profundinema]